MELGVIALIVLGVLALAGIVRAPSGPSRVISGMWRYHAPEWPSGVQEDDDAHWSWKAPPGTQDDATDPAARLDVGVTPLRYEVRSGDRAKS